MAVEIGSLEAFGHFRSLQFLDFGSGRPVCKVDLMAVEIGSLEAFGHFRSLQGEGAIPGESESALDCPGQSALYRKKEEKKRLIISTPGSLARKRFQCWT
ncbi:MAG: hypothetical protein V9H69_14135 [Anaerolineae bacterium]